VLVESRELVRLRVAPREVRDRARLRQALVAAGVPKPWAARATDSTRKWVEIPGRVAAERRRRGDGHARRARGAGDAARAERVGAGAAHRRRVGARRAAVDGVELALDTLLRGTPGTRQLLRDARGGRFESPACSRWRAPGAHGGAHAQLRAAGHLRARARRRGGRMGATGGDIVVLDPHAGEVRALASQRADGAQHRGDGARRAVRARVHREAVRRAALLARGRAPPHEV
jgi:cell division protein FtsI (penicillin-binding protein 3)